MTTLQQLVVPCLFHGLVVPVSICNENRMFHKISIAFRGKKDVKNDQVHPTYVKCRNVIYKFMTITGKHKPGNDLYWQTQRRKCANIFFLEIGL